MQRVRRAQEPGDGELGVGLSDQRIDDEREGRRCDGDAAESAGEVVAVAVRRIAAGLDFEAVVETVAVRVGQKRIGNEAVGAEDHFLAVADAVVVTVVAVRIGAELELLQVRQAVAVGVELRVGRVVRIEAVGQLVVVGHAVAVGVAGGGDGDARHPQRAFIRGAEKSGAGAARGDQAVLVDGGNGGVAGEVGRAGRSGADVDRVRVGIDGGGGELRRRADRAEGGQ